MGKLYIVATPIGNLADITERAVATLRDVDLIACEDTRHSKKLLNHLGISTKLTSYHAHSSSAKEDAILADLQQGKDVALVTDAGTPGISDPGGRLVARARAEGILTLPIPGPSAVAAAVSVSGLGGDQFTFLGFLPHKKGRQTKLSNLAELPMPVVLYESPHRLVKLLGELAERYPDSTVFVAREMTKKFEEYRTGSPRELREWYASHPPRGEITVMVSV